MTDTETKAWKAISPAIRAAQQCGDYQLRRTAATKLFAVESELPDLTFYQREMMLWLAQALDSGWRALSLDEVAAINRAFNCHP